MFRAFVIVGLLAVSASAAAPPTADEMIKDAEQNPDRYITPDQRASALKADTLTAVMRAVKAQLKDADSAKFRGIKRKGAFSYCGWVNAKNSYGGYTGYSVFYATQKATVIIPPNLSEPELC